MKAKLLLISLIFTILSCSKDDDLPPPDLNICNCEREVIHRRDNGRIVFQETTNFVSECLGTTVEEDQVLDVTITTTIRCFKP